MPSRLRDSDRNRVTPRKDTDKAERPESRSGHKSSRRKGSRKTVDKTLEKTSESAPLSTIDGKRRSSMPGTLDTEEAVTDAGLVSKTSIPYPTFSKAHSKEAVTSRDELRPSLNIFTPDPTDLDTPKDKRPSRAAAVGEAPPSPPLTSVDQHGGGNRSESAKRAGFETLQEEKKSHLEKTVKIKLQPKSSRPSGHFRTTSEVGSPTKTPLPSKQSTPLKLRVEGELKRSVSQPTKVVSPPPSSLAATEVETTASSNATSIAPNQPHIQRPGSRPPQVKIADDMSSLVTSVLDEGGASRSQTPLEIFVEDSTTAVSDMSNHPPPPPPPPLAPISQPKVDYLLQHGGLNQSVPKSFLLAGKPVTVLQAVSTQPNLMVASLFEPFSRLLDDYKHVVSKSGSLAVATGYRSVARRLLDRLEAVFARDISSETCQCCVCALVFDEGEDVPGVSWGEILELVAGRRDLPPWPPFSLATAPTGLGIDIEAHTPMQKLDVDVPEEYREHYIRQSRKTKQSVDRWLSRQPESSSSPPEGVDDETLSFAILTHLSYEQRPSFRTLLGIVNTPSEPPKRVPSPQRGPTPQPAPTPQPRHRPEPIIIASRAVQRLYRLASPPRDPEVAIYLLENPRMHNALATLAAVSDDEWEILISGRFDGFLRSGADDLVDTPQPVGRQTSLRSVNSRGPTPLHPVSHSRTGTHPSRTTTPASGAQYGAPIAYDEETEVATLAEIERDIYSGMEALEDAFEALHVKAETVRQALRERGAGLAAMQQRRRGGLGDGVEVRMGTPASGLIGDGRWEADTDDGMLGDWDGNSELAPDDSASNISSSRRRRPKRRNERRTPALVEEEEEEDEDLEESDGTASPRKR